MTQGDRVCNRLRTLMDIECHFQRIVIEGQVLQVNQNLIREVNIGYFLQCEEKTPRTPHLP